nr:tRNA (guanine(37)-N1)-methyltransferase [Ipomoea batatas]
MPPPTVRCHLLPCNDATATVTRLPEGRRWRSSAYGQRRPPPSSNLLSDGPDGTDLEPLLYSSLCEQVIFDFRFLTLLAIGGSLAGSLLCFLNVISFTYISYFL